VARRGPPPRASGAPAARKRDLLGGLEGTESVYKIMNANLAMIKSFGRDIFHAFDACGPVGFISGAMVVSCKLGAVGPRLSAATAVSHSAFARVVIFDGMF